MIRELHYGDNLDVLRDELRDETIDLTHRHDPG